MIVVVVTWLCSCQLSPAVRAAVKAGVKTVITVMRDIYCDVDTISWSLCWCGHGDGNLATQHSQTSHKQETSPLLSGQWTRVRAAIEALFPEMPISSEPEDFTVFSLKLDPAPAREKFKLCTIFLFTVGSGRSLAGAAEHGAPS